MNQRELVVNVDGHGVDGRAGMILVYRDGDRLSVVLTTEKNGDAEVMLDRSTAVLLGASLRDAF